MVDKERLSEIIKQYRSWNPEQIAEKIIEAVKDNSCCNDSCKRRLEIMDKALDLLPDNLVCVDCEFYDICESGKSKCKEMYLKFAEEGKRGKWALRDNQDALSNLHFRLIKSIELPFKVGEFVYEVSQASKKIIAWEIKSIDLRAHNKFLVTCGREGIKDYPVFWDKEIGELWFATRKEAEKKLEKLKDVKKCENK